MPKSLKEHALYPRVADAYFSKLLPSRVSEVDVTWDEFADGLARGTNLTRATVNSLLVAPNLTETVREHYPHLVQGQQEITKYLKLWQHAKFHPRFHEYRHLFGSQMSWWSTEAEQLAAACFDFATAGWNSFSVRDAKDQGFTWAEIAEAARTGVALEYIGELRVA